MNSITKTIQISERTFAKCVGRMPRSVDELHFFAELFAEYEWEDLISGDWNEMFEDLTDDDLLPPEPESDTITVPLYSYLNEEEPDFHDDPAVGDKVYDTDSIQEVCTKMLQANTGLPFRVVMDW